MQSPVNNSVFDSRDLIEYRDFLASELVDNFNTILIEENEEAEEISDISEVDFENEAFSEMYSEEIEEYEQVNDFCEELSNYAADFEHGESIIHSDYFEDYARGGVLFSKGRKCARWLFTRNRIDFKFLASFRCFSKRAIVCYWMIEFYNCAVLFILIGRKWYANPGKVF